MAAARTTASASCAAILDVVVAVRFLFKLIHTRAQLSLRRLQSVFLAALFCGRLLSRCLETCVQEFELLVFNVEVVSHHMNQISQ